MPPRTSPARAVLALALLLPNACMDTGGPAVDRVAPSLTSRVLAHDGSTVTLPAAQAFAFNEHILLLLTMRDDRRVAWIGFHVTEPVDIADSVAVPDSLDALQVLVALNLGEGFAGVVRLSGFARDAAGNRTEQVAIGNPVSVYRPLVGATATAPLPGPVTDVALDPRRDRVYIAQPESTRVLVLALASMTFEPPLATPSAPGGLDLTVSGDSLVVSFPATGQLGITALDAAPPTWTLVDLVTGGDGRRPTGVRVSAGNKAFVPLSAEGTGGAGGGGERPRVRPRDGRGPSPQRPRPPGSGACRHTGGADAGPVQAPDLVRGNVLLGRGTGVRVRARCGPSHPASCSALPGPHLGRRNRTAVPARRDAVRSGAAAETDLLSARPGAGLGPRRSGRVRLLRPGRGVPAYAAGGRRHHGVGHAARETRAITGSPGPC